MRNLLGRLLHRTAEDIDRMARFWGVDLRGYDRHGDVSSVYRAMTDIWAVRDAWELTDADARLLLAALQGAEGVEVSRDQLAQTTGLALEQVHAAADWLLRVGLAHPEEQRRGRESVPTSSTTPAIFIARETSQLLDRLHAERASAAAPADRDRLEALLPDVPYPELEEAASLWGARVVPALHARGEILALVQEQITHPQRVEQMVQRLSTPAKALWTQLRKAGGSAPLDRLLPPADVPRPRRRRILRELATPLLVWHAWEVDPDGDNERRLLVIPRAILEPQPRTAEPLPELVDVDSAEVLDVDWLFPCAAAWDLLAIIREVQLQAQQAGGLRWRTLTGSDAPFERRMRRRLWRARFADDGEPVDLPTGYVPFIAGLGAALGVLQETPTERATPGEAAAGWREHAFTTAQRRMVDAWERSETWLEGQERVDVALYGAVWSTMRTALLRALAELDEDTWYEEERFVARLLRAEPDLLRGTPVAAAPRRGVETAADARERWQRLQELIVITTLETAGVWLGLIERSSTLTGRVAVLRVTPFGRWVIGKRVEPSLPSTGPTPLAVGANFQILLYRPTPRRVWALSAFADVQSLDRVSTWTLSADALTRALANGVTLEQVVAFLERANGGALPPNVAYTLAEWDRGYRRIRLRRAVVLLPEDDAGDGSAAIAAADALRDAGLQPEALPDGRILLLFDEPDAAERLHTAATRALRSAGFAPLGNVPNQPEGRSRRERDRE